jgi:hypothetical protein
MVKRILTDGGTFVALDSPGPASERRLRTDN